jgi:hypothetical protein
MHRVVCTDDVEHVQVLPQLLLLPGVPAGREDLHGPQPIPLEHPGGSARDLERLGAGAALQLRLLAAVAARALHDLRLDGMDGLRQLLARRQGVLGCHRLSPRREPIRSGEAE